MPLTGVYVSTLVGDDVVVGLVVVGAFVGLREIGAFVGELYW